MDLKRKLCWLIECGVKVTAISESQLPLALTSRSSQDYLQYNPRNSVYNHHVLQTSIMSVRRDQFSGSSSLKNLKNRYHGSTSDLPSTINLGGESRVRPRRGSYPFPKSQQTAIRAISQLPPKQPTSNQLQRQWHVNAYDQRKTTSLVVRTPLAQQPRRIYFYHKTDPYYGFTNFSDHPVVFNGQRYPTSEHLFQSLKVSTPFDSIVAVLLRC